MVYIFKDNHIFLENICNNQITCDNIISLYNISFLDINKKTLYFDKCKFILNQKQYLHMNVYDCIVHNYVLLEKEHKDQNPALELSTSESKRIRKKA